MRKANNISWGLFNYRGRYFWRNIKDIPIFLGRIIFALKHGYAPHARWETYAWFTDTIQEILEWYRDERTGSPYFVSHEEYDEIIRHMISLLYDMDECNPKYKDLGLSEKDTAMNNAKDEFFKLFAQYFYNLWD